MKERGIDAKQSIVIDALESQKLGYLERIKSIEQKVD
jgi:hypothetical protein